VRWGSSHARFRRRKGWPRICARGSWRATTWPRWPASSTTTQAAARAGDLGWVHRYNPDLPRFLDRGFLLAPGELAPVVRSTAGFVVLRREK
jgi:hypothetical protein